MLAGLTRVAPFLVLGPLTGPLAAGLFHNLKAGRHFMGGVYALGIIEVVFGLPAVLAKELAYLAHFRL